MVEPKQSVEEQFRSTLEDLVTVADKLSSVCSTIEEMVGMVKLALENPGQLRLLMREVVNQKR